MDEVYIGIPGPSIATIRNGAIVYSESEFKIKDFGAIISMRMKQLDGPVLRQWLNFEPK